MIALSWLKNSRKGLETQFNGQGLNLNGKATSIHPSTKFFYSSYISKVSALCSLKTKSILQLLTAILWRETSGMFETSFELCTKSLFLPPT